MSAPRAYEILPLVNYLTGVSEGRAGGKPAGQNVGHAPPLADLKYEVAAGPSREVLAVIVNPALPPQTPTEE
jgi:hypothetical protein